MRFIKNLFYKINYDEIVYDSVLLLINEAPFINAFLVEEVFKSIANPSSYPLFMLVINFFVSSVLLYTLSEFLERIEEYKNKTLSQRDSKHHSFKVLYFKMLRILVTLTVISFGFFTFFIAIKTLSPAKVVWLLIPGWFFTFLFLVVYIVISVRIWAREEWEEKATRGALNCIKFILVLTLLSGSCSGGMYVGDLLDEYLGIKGKGSRGALGIIFPMILTLPVGVGCFKLLEVLFSEKTKESETDKSKRIIKQLLATFFLSLGLNIFFHFVKIFEIESGINPLITIFMGEILPLRLLFLLTPPVRVMNFIIMAISYFIVIY